jgi:hypothetical protein
MPIITNDSDSDCDSDSDNNSIPNLKCICLDIEEHSDTSSSIHHHNINIDENSDTSSFNHNHNHNINIDENSDTSSFNYNHNHNINIDENSDASSFNHNHNINIDENSDTSSFHHTNIIIDANSDTSSFHHTNIIIDANSDTSTFYSHASSCHDVNSDISSSEYNDSEIIDIAVLYNYSDDKSNIQFAKIKLVPIQIDFDIFKNIFFKKRSQVLDIRVLDVLFDKLKVSLINNILSFQHFSVPTNILFKKEMFALVVSENIKQKVCLNLDEIILLQQLQKCKTAVSRVTLNLWIHTLSIGLRIEFIFNIKNIKHVKICEKRRQIDLIEYDDDYNEENYEEHNNGNHE